MEKKGAAMPPLNMLIKPASSSCNLRCKYCFYSSIADNRNIKSYGIMSIETLETIAEKAFAYAEGFVSFAFQGGEPTLAGLEFFEKLVELQKKYNTKNIQVFNSLQTNGVKIDEKWASFLAKNNFLVGISLDGPKDIHDSNRIDVNSNGSYKNVMNAIKLFDKYQVQYNILCVINSRVARHVNKVYDFFKKNNFNYLQFIPCLDGIDEKLGSNPYSLKPEAYEAFLKTIFDLWYRDVVQGQGISIRYFDNLISMFLGNPPEACGMSGSCTCQFVIESDGGVYPCDFYAEDNWYLGSIKEMGFKDIKEGEKVKSFIEKSRVVDPKCKQCKWLGLCRGGCRRNREPVIEGKLSLNYFCTSYYEFFNYAVPRLQQIARSLSHK